MKIEPQVAEDDFKHDWHDTSRELRHLSQNNEMEKVLKRYSIPFRKKKVELNYIESHFEIDNLFDRNRLFKMAYGFVDNNFSFNAVFVFGKHKLWHVFEYDNKFMNNLIISKQYSADIFGKRLVWLFL